MEYWIGFAFGLASEWLFTITFALFVFGSTEFGGTYENRFDPPWLLTTTALVLIAGVSFYVLGFNKGTLLLLFYGLAGYLAVGVLWSFFKWIRLMSQLRDVLMKPDGTFEYQSGAESSYRKLEKAVWGMHRIHLSSYFDQDDIVICYNSNGHLEVKSVQPRISSGRNHAFIKAWIYCWPSSMLDYLCSRALKELIEGIVRILRKSYEAVGRSIFR